MSATSAEEWFRLRDECAVRSPALLVYRERVEENLRRMIAIAGSPERLRPHVKTHKMPALIKRQLELGITRFKCATLREAEMTAECGAPDVLVAYPPVGPNIRAFQALRAAFPETEFSALVDDATAAAALADEERPVTLLVDLDIGQHRTGIAPEGAAEALYRLIATTPGLRAGGLHAYDGHLSDPDPEARAQACDAAFALVLQLRDRLLAAGLPVPRVIAGGTPTFPMHARRDGVECSPGTCVFSDAGYASKLPDQHFLYAALVVTRVVSKPGNNRLCLDLGHKAVASEMTPPRVIFPQLPDAIPVVHSEEHLVVETTRGADFPVGTLLYGIPWHICPTVALHEEALVVEDGRVTTTWAIAARGRKLQTAC